MSQTSTSNEFSNTSISSQENEALSDEILHTKIQLENLEHQIKSLPMSILNELYKGITGKSTKEVDKIVYARKFGKLVGLIRKSDGNRQKIYAHVERLLAKNKDHFVESGR